MTHKTVKVIEVKPVSTRYTEKQRGGSVSMPFWSDAMKAFVMEYREKDDKAAGGVWESRIYASDANQVQVMWDALCAVTTRQQWMEQGHRAAKNMTAMGNDWFLYRTMIGGRAERLHEC